MFHSYIVLLVCYVCWSWGGHAETLPGRHSMAKHVQTRHAMERRLIKPGPNTVLLITDRPNQNPRGAPPVYQKRLRKPTNLGRQLLSTAAREVRQPAIHSFGSSNFPSDLGVEGRPLKEIEDGERNTRKYATGVEFPGKRFVAQIFSNNTVAVMDNVENEFIYFASITGHAIDSTTAFSLYTLLKVIFDASKSDPNVFGISDCLSLPKTTFNVDALMVGVTIKRGTICGLKELEVGNKVTVVKDDIENIIVTMPCVFRNPEVNITSVDFTGYFVMENQPVETSIKEIDCQCSLRFKKGTPLRLYDIATEAAETVGLSIRMIADGGGLLAKAVQEVEPKLGRLVETWVNTKLPEIEQKISYYLLRTSPSPTEGLPSANPT